MGSKGTSTQQQTYSANPQIQGAGTQALNQAQSAASLPFNLPTAPVAGFSPDQLQAFQQTQQQQGIAQPYINQAQGLFQQSAQPLTASQIGNYLNPYASNVISQLQNVQGQQMQDLTGKATQAAGGVGADRIGVAQGQLANQQSLATGQTLAGIYGSALTAAQQNQQMQQSAGYGIGQLGGAAQNAAMQGTNALLGTGGLQQQLSQAQLNAPYQNQLAQAAFPYQQAQYLAGITGNLAGAFGGTTYGQSTPAPPSPYSQIAGLGTGLAGAYGAYNSVNNNANGPWAGPSSVGGAPSAAEGGRIGYARGGFAAGGSDGGMGEANWMTDDPVIPVIQMHPSQVNQPKLTQQTGSTDNIGTDIGNVAKAAAQIAPLFLANRGGAVYPPHMDDGGTFPDDPVGDSNRQIGYDMLRKGMGTTAPRSIPGGDPAPEPYRMPDVKEDGSPLVPNSGIYGPGVTEDVAAAAAGKTPTKLTVHPNDDAPDRLWRL